MSRSIFGFGQTLPIPAPAAVHAPPPERIKRAGSNTPPRRCPVCACLFCPKPSQVKKGQGESCSMACRVALRQAREGATIRVRLLDALGDGGRVAREIGQATGLCTPTAMVHLRAMAADGLVQARPRDVVHGKGPRGVGWWLAKAEAAE